MIIHSRSASEESIKNVTLLNMSVRAKIATPPHFLPSLLSLLATSSYPHKSTDKVILSRKASFKQTIAGALCTNEWRQPIQLHDSHTLGYKACVECRIRYKGWFWTYKMSFVVLCCLCVVLCCFCVVLCCFQRGALMRYQNASIRLYIDFVVLYFKFIHWSSQLHNQFNFVGFRYAFLL